MGIRLVVALFCVGLLGLSACVERTPAAASPDADASREADVSQTEAGAEVITVNVKVFNHAGELVGPIDMPKVVKSDEEWQKQLTPDQYQISRGKGTERPFCGTLLDNKLEGVYACVGCDLPLFSSDSKFNSGTGWPSFFQPVAKENVIEIVDRSHGMVRTEILCARCDGHLGHVFDDGPRPSGLRFCVNSESLTFTKKAELAKLADPAAPTTTPTTARAGASTEAPTGDSTTAAAAQPPTRSAR